MFITVMLAVLAVVTLLLAIYFPAADPARDPLRAMHVVTFNGSWIAGIICLALIPIVYRMRQTRPPRNVTIATIVIGIVPMLVYGATQVWHLLR